MTNTHTGRALLAIAICLVLMTSTRADEPPRKWRDKSGRFEVEAKLLEYANGKAKLLKEDGRVVEVAVTALSDADQQYLKDLADTDNPFAGGELMKPAADAGAVRTEAGSGSKLLAADYSAEVLPADAAQVVIDFDEPVPPLPADPSKSVASFQEFTRPLEQLDAYARTSSPVLVNPQTLTFAVSTHRAGNTVDPTTFGRIYLVSPNVRQPKPVLNIDQTFLLFDHHVPSGRSLGVIGVNSPSERGGDLVLLENLADGQPRAIARWHVPQWDRPGFKPKVEFARLVDADRGIAQVNDTVYLWDFKNGEPVFKIDRIRAGSKIQVSGTGSYLAIPTGGACALVGVEQGEYLGNVPFPSTLTPEVAFAPNGEQLALVAGNQIAVWELTTASVVAEATVGNPCGKLFGWIGDDYLLTQLAGLIDPQLGMTLWHYGLPSNNQAVTMPGGVVAVDKLQTAALLSLPVPHEPVESVARRLSGGDDTLMVIRPGTDVALQIEAVAGVDREAMYESLKKAVEAVGWKVSSQAPIQVCAKIEQGKKQKLRFRMMGTSFLNPDAIQTATIKPYTASLVIRRGEDVLWARSMTNMVPGFLTLERGETLQKAVKKFEKPDPDYFQRLAIPPRILRPEIRKTVGRSRIANGKWVDYFPGR